MSIQLVITKLLVRLSGSKRITGLPKDKMLKQIRRRNKLNHFFLPKDGEFIYRDERVRVIDLDGATGNNRRSVSSEGFSEEFHCLAICHKNKAKRAVLCVYGGGLLLAPPRMFVGFAKKMAANTGADVWFPYYPLCDEYTIRDSVRMLISPGGIPSTEEEWEKMQSLNSKDIMLSAQYMRTIQPLLSHGKTTIPQWMQSCDGADFSGFPETWIYYGTSEVLSAKAASYDEMLTKAGVKHHLKMAKDMPHCYCATVFFPEAREDYEETMRILRE